MALITILVPALDEPGLFSFLHDLNYWCIGFFGFDDYKIVLDTQPGGLGKSLKHMISKIEYGSYVLTIDADGQHDPKDIWNLWEWRDRRTLVIGAKGHIDSRPLWKRWLSKIVYWRYRRFGGPNVHDMGSNFRLYPPGFLQKWDMTHAPDTHAIEHWLLNRAQLSGLRIVEVPCDFLPRNGGKSKLSLWRELRSTFQKPY